MASPVYRRGLAILALSALVARIDPASGQAAAPKLTRLSASLGFVHAAGNTSLMTLSGEERLEHRTADSLWLFSQFALAVHGRTADSTTASLLKAGVRAGRAISKRLSAFVGGSAERNRFAGIRRRFEELVGLGFQAIATARDQLAIEAGGAFTQQRNLAGVDDKFVAARLAAAFKHLLSQTAYVQQLAEFLPNIEEGDDLRINAETSLVAPLSTRISLKLSYAIRFDNLPEPGFEKTDRIFTSGLQVSF